MKKARSVSSWGKAEVLCLLLFCALGVLFIPAQVQAYYIESSVYVSIWNYDQKYGHYMETDAAVESQYSESLTGPSDQVVEARTSANLATGILRAYAKADNGFGSATQFSSASAQVRFLDQLYFTVPAGYYSEGVSVAATGFAEGSISRQGTTRVSYAFGAWFGSEMIYVSPTDPDGDQFFEFTLTTLLVPAGRTLTEPEEFSVPVAGALLIIECLSGYGEDVAEVDFYDSACFFLQTPEGVTWTSDSGVFLASQIPLPPPCSCWAPACWGWLAGGDLKRVNHS